MRTTTTGIFAALLLFLAPAASAQQADSFFDVFADVSLPPAKTECIACDIIRQWIRDKEMEIWRVDFNLLGARLQAPRLQNSAADARREAEKAEKALKDFENPKSWVENADGSGHLDSSDLAAMRRLNADLWQQYKDGDITAQELSDAWGNVTPADRERAKDQIEKELADRAREARAEADKLQKELDDLMRQIREWEIQRAGMEAYIESLQKSLEECERKCKVSAVDPITEYEDQFPVVEQDSWWDDIVEWFGFGDDEEDDEQQPPMTTDGPGGGVGGQGEDVPGGGTDEGEPMTPADSFFDIFTDLDLSPPTLRCLLCDPILEEIEELEHELKELQNEFTDAQRAKAEADKNVHDAEGKKAAAEKALNDFRNPRSWIENADGSGRIDSSDLAAQRARNQSLWQDYKNGDLSAQELSDAWGKPMTPQERDEWKEKVEEGLEQAVKDAKSALDAAKEAQQQAADAVSDIQKDMQDILDEIKRLQAEYEECLKRCVEIEEELDLIGVLDGAKIEPDDGGADETGIFDWFEDLFSGDDEESDSDDEPGDLENGEASEAPMSSAASEAASARSTSDVSDDGSAVKGSFTEVGGLETEVPVIDYRTGPEDAVTGKIPGVRKTCTIESKRTCTLSCDGECVEEDGCYVCQKKAAEDCKSDTMESGACGTGCSNGRCVKSYVRDDGVACYRCELKSDGEEDQPVCSSGKTRDRDACEEACQEEGGTCTADDSGCYGCVVVRCPSGTYTNECPSSCASGCDTVGQEAGVTCYACKKSCTDVCSQQGYAQVGTNWSSYLQSYLSEYSCVSGASVKVTTATIGSCTCSNQPEVTVNMTPPICKGTPCGDVACGQSASCQQGESTLTVRCNWGGWQNIGENKFQPVLGQ
ncbi:MAG: hypothetical protein G01um101425_945 [Candidatus Peregrinibacteria bacterium Gr01-1014_25]|nr:MAG: hypothetical protein G01um101425_945 [Candidatus Peregrinibacteria bacterium Gr01-1014_25]